MLKRTDKVILITAESEAKHRICFTEMV